MCSYENHYSKLVENMLKNDLVLRGTVDTVELLIFPSNILSKNFPSKNSWTHSSGFIFTRHMLNFYLLTLSYSASGWNMLYFLWGVFRVRRKDYSSIPPEVPKCTGESNSNEDPGALGLNASVQSSSHSTSNDINNFPKLETNFVKNTTYADNEHLQTLDAYHQECLVGANSFNPPVSGAALDKSHDSVTASSTKNNGAINNSAAVIEKNHQVSTYFSF
jgi:hypothetical protein